jgi:hypothetical protein
LRATGVTGALLRTRPPTRPPLSFAFASRLISLFVESVARRLNANGKRERVASVSNVQRWRALARASRFGLAQDERLGG